jgi:very-short-patch-repair endonuclease
VRVSHDVSALVGPRGWCTWEQLTSRVDRKTVAAWVGAGRLVRMQSGIYAPPQTAADVRVRVDAATSALDGLASHSTALALWNLVPRMPGPVHVLVDQRRSGRGPAGVVLHRTTELDDVRRRVMGLPVTSVDRAVVDSWGRPAGLSRPDVRGAAITAVRERLCSPADLSYELARRPKLPGRAALGELIELLLNGCRSELEIWGCLNVLRGPGMPIFTLQRRVEVGGRTFFLDAACDEVKLAVEMDGAAYHGSPQQREDDIGSGALLATVGWQTLRFSFRRMTDAPDACRRDIRSAYVVRRRLFGLDEVR